MPYSYDKFDWMIQGFLQSHFPRKARILDVGPGSGKYRKLLRGYTMDCLEIHEPYISQFGLRDKYNKVYIGNMMDFDFKKNRYDLVILGDVIEHLSIREAQTVLRQVYNSLAFCFVALPFLYTQGPIDDCVYETHLQPDLTHAEVLRRYPSLSLLHMDDTYGLYTGPDDWLQCS